MSLKDWLTAHLQQGLHADAVVSMVKTLDLVEWVTADWCNGKASTEVPPTEESVKDALLALAGRDEFDKAHRQLVARGLPCLVTALEQAWNNKRKRLTGMCVCGAARAG